MSKSTRWLAAVLLLAFSAILVLSRRGERTFVGGPPLPPGKVQPQIAMTWDSAAIVAPDGSLWAWGGRLFGLQCIFSNFTVTPVPLRVGKDSDWSRVALGVHSTLAIKQDGSLWGWGSNAEWALASAPSNRVYQPWRIDGANDWVDVRAGAGHVMAMKRDRSLWIWGQNSHGQIGDGTTNNCRMPKMVMAHSKWKSISPGAFNSYAIAEDGTLWGWGFSFLGASAGSDDVTPVELIPGGKWKSISAGDYSLVAVREDGTLWAGGQNLSRLFGAPFVVGRTNRLVQVGNSTNWADVWAGQGGVIVRKQDGSWWASNTDPAIMFHATKANQAEPELRRFNGDFDPLAMSIGWGTTTILSRDGILSTSGERLGEARTASLVARLEVMISRVFGAPRAIQPRPPVDTQPYVIWKIPSANDVGVHP